MGKGAALRTGFQNCLGPYGVQDADMEYDPKDLEIVAAARERPSGCGVWIKICLE